MKVKEFNYIPERFSLILEYLRLQINPKQKIKKKNNNKKKKNQTNSNVASI